MWNKDWVINIKATQFEMSPEVSEYIDEKLDSIAKLAVVENEDTEIKCDIEIEKSKAKQSGPIWRAEMNLTIGGENFRSESRGESINAALDEVKDDMARILRKNKNKRFNMVRRSGAKIKDWIRFGSK